MTPDTAAAPSVVLDTNALLDWLVFRNPVMGGVSHAVTSGRLVWLTSAAVRDELAHVLGRGVASAWQPDVQAIWSMWERFGTLQEQPLANAAGPALRCTDTDDQKFIDLAIAHRARWLVTRDRAVLKLARKAAPRGLVIVTPQRWQLTG